MKRPELKDYQTKAFHHFDMEAYAKALNQYIDHLELQRDLLKEIFDLTAGPWDDPVISEDLYNRMKSFQSKCDDCKEMINESKFTRSVYSVLMNARKINKKIDEFMNVCAENALAPFSDESFRVVPAGQGHVKVLYIEKGEAITSLLLSHDELDQSSNEFK